MAAFVRFAVADPRAAGGAALSAFQPLRSRHGLQWSLKVAGSTAAASQPLLSVLTVWTIVVLVAMPGHTPGWLGQGKPAGMPSPRTLCQESATAL